MRKPSAIQVVFAVVLAMSAVGFALAARAERDGEASISPSTSSPEGSAAREAAERGQSALTTTTSSTLGSREAAEHAQATTSTAAPATLPPSTTGSSPPALATSSPETLPYASTGSDRLVDDTLFGVRTESTRTTAVGVVILIAAATAVLFARHRWQFVAVAVLAGMFALLDLREALHQHDETRLSLALAATALALAHLTAAVLGILAARTAIDLSGREA